jgi:hypothetical protein
MASGCVRQIHVGAPVLPPAPPIPEPPESLIAANIQASLEAVGPALDDAIPVSFNTGAQCIGGGVACVQAYLGREPIRFSIEGNRLRLNSLIHYQMDGNFLGVTGSCGRPDNTRRRVALALESNVSWSPGWTISLANSATNVNPIDRCRVTVFNVDVTDKAMGAFRRGLESLPDRANERLQELGRSMRSRLGAAWSLLSGPIALDRNVWLTLRPGQMSVTPLTVQNETLNINAALTARPRISLGDFPPSEATTDLPALSVEPVAGEFHVAPVLNVAFSMVNDALSVQLKGKTFTRKIFLLPDLRVTVAGTQVIGSGKRIAIGLDLDGSVKGRIWFIGDVDYDTASRTLRITLADFTVETTELLPKIAAWLVPQLINELIKGVFPSYSHALGPALDDARLTLLTALNRDFGSDVRLTTEIDEVKVGTPFSQSESFVLLADMTGRSRLTIGPGGAVPSGREVRFVSVSFSTISDDKDAEEPVNLWIEDARGRVIAQRTVGVSERWGDGETQGPYSMRIPTGISECSDLTLRVRKTPIGSPTGKGWNMSMTASITRSNGQDVIAASSPRSDWGDGGGNSYDRRFSLRCQSLDSP